jgi:N-acetylmuramoyl-L-alanine amidase
MKFMLQNKYLVFALLFSILSIAQTHTKFKVVLDAGHGDQDFGATYHGFIEKNIALAVVLKVGKILEADPTVQVTYTRKTDVFVELVERANVANRIDANFFISIHCNANKNTEAYGAETYVMGLNKNASNLEVARKENAVIALEDDYKTKYAGYNLNSPESIIGTTILQEEYLDQSIELASKIQDGFDVKLNRKVRGVKQAPFMVLHKAYMPRVLIEMGFISNLEEGTYLNSEEGQQNIAKTIADAIFRMKVEHFGGAMPTIQIQKSERAVVKKDSTPKPSPQSAKILPQQSSTETPKLNEVSNLDLNKVVYKIQLKASSAIIETKSQNFNGLDRISFIKEKGFYKYLYGETNEYDIAKLLLLEARAKKYESAFIIAFKQGKKISLNEALKNN